MPWCDLLVGKIRLVISVEAAVCRSLLAWLGRVGCGQAAVVGLGARALCLLQIPLLRLIFGLAALIPGGNGS